jgi:DNA-binding transcriptional LysR family regulator
LARKRDASRVRLDPYRLTQAGEDLLARAQDVEAAMVSLKCWKEGAAGERMVRLSAGSWTSAFVASHIDDIWTVEDRFGIELVTAMEKVDIGRRNADLDDAADAAGEALENLVESGRYAPARWGRARRRPQLGA